LKTFLSWALKRRKIKYNPAQGIDKLKVKSRREKVWTHQQLQGFCDAAKPKLRDIFLASFFTGQRVGDVCSFAWSNYDGKWLNVVQQKTGAEVNLPVYKLQPLKQVLDIQPKVGPTIFR
jgi:integrase